MHRLLIIPLILLLGGDLWPQSTLTAPAMAPVDCDNLNCLYGSATRNTSVDDTEEDGMDLDVDSGRVRSLDEQSAMGDRERGEPSGAPSGGQNDGIKRGGREPGGEKDSLKSEEPAGRNRREASERRPPDYRPYQKYEKREESEFQKQVLESTGRKLEIYGGNLFTRLPGTFAPLEQSPVPNGYVIAPGDTLQIRAWGQIDLAARVKVDRGGEIYLPKVGTINVAGVRFDQLEAYLKNAVGRLFRNFDLSVNLGKLHSIQVYVAGAARRPGSYTVSSFSTLSSVIFASGGPAGDGSMRRIQLKRRGRVMAEFDLYDLLIRGDTSNDAGLFSGDVVFIPPVGAQVAVSGSVKRPAIYELLGAISVRQQIAAAGGLGPGASSIIQRETLTPRGTRERLNLSSDDAKESLRDGDILFVPAGSGAPEKVVMLRGSVTNPGPRPWHQNMRVSELISSSQELVQRKYWFFYKKLGGDKADWYHEPEFREREKADFPEEGREPQSDREPPTDGSRDRVNATVSVARLNNDINWDYATIQRLSPDLTSKLIDFRLGEALDPSKRGTADDPELEDHDIVTVFSQRDLRVPSEKRTRLVRIEGEVNAPGIYAIAPGENLRDLVAHAGGVTPLAYLFAANFRRESTRKEQQARLQQMVEEMDRQLRSRAATLSQTDPAERAAEQEQLTAERGLMDKLRQSKASGRIVLELRPGDSDIARLPGLRLEDGDRFLIPPRPATVEVVGAVYNQNSFIYKAGKTVRQYLSQSGGGTRDADRARLFVVRADGSVVSKQMTHGLWAGSFEAMRLTPGDTIIMPERIRTGGLLKGIRDWSQVFSQFALGAAAIRVVSP